MLVTTFMTPKIAPLRLGNAFGFFDLNIYRESARVALSGRDLYAAHFQYGFGFTYPPIAIVPFFLLTALPLHTDELAVTVLNIGLVAVLARLTVRMMQPPAPLGRRPSEPSARAYPGPGVAWIAAAFALWTEPVIATIGYGQVNLVVTCLVLADLTYGRRSGWGGCGIGAAAALKLTPLVFVPYLFLSGRTKMAWRAAGTFAASIVAALAIMPWNAVAYWGRAVFDTNRVSGGGEFAGRGTVDQSLRGLVKRISGNDPHVQVAWLLACVIVAVVGLWLAVRAGRRGEEMWGFTLTAIVGLLVSPITWDHHWCIAIPGLLAAAITSADSLRGWVRRGLAIAVAIGSSAIWIAISDDPNGVHLGVVGVITADPYVLAGLVVIACAGVREIRSTGAFGALRRWRGPLMTPAARTVVARSQSLPS